VAETTPPDVAAILNEELDGAHVLRKGQHHVVSMWSELERAASHPLDGGVGI
jgi:hypothetical protein